MNRGSHGRFSFPADLPLGDVAPGTNVLVTGPSGRGAREVALRLAADLQSDDEATLLVSADVDGRSLLERCERLVPTLDRARLAIVDSSGVGADDQARFEPHAVRIEDPSALPEIGVELSTLYETLRARGHDGVRIGVFSLSSLLVHANLRAVSRFVHMLTGRVIATGDLGVFLLDEDAVDDRAVETLGQFFDGRVEVRDDEQGFSVRQQGLDDGEATWTPVDLRATD